MADLQARLVEALGERHVSPGATDPDLQHDECLTVPPTAAALVVHPGCTADVAAVLRIAAEFRVPVTARGRGTGMSGAAVPRPDGVLVAFDRMDAVLEIDEGNHVAVVQPGVTLARLDEATRPVGLFYPVSPGEGSASLGGNVATNAGGMRAVRYGVTRHHVLGVEAVLVGGEVIRTGGRYVKTSSGYDLTQLIVGSEGTLALVTEVTLRLSPRTTHQATLLAPFPTFGAVTAAVPPIIASGVGPVILEYIDFLTMAAITANVDLDLGIPQQVKETAQAYLVVMLEQRDAGRLEEDVGRLGDQLTGLGATDVYVLPGGSAHRLIDAREKTFWVAKAAGANDIVDVVVPRAAMPEFLDQVRQIAEQHSSHVVGCGHAGDGNVHLGVFQPDPQVRHRLLHELFAVGHALGGAISGEHGIGQAKRHFFAELTDPTVLALLRRLKAAFDPDGILNPAVLFEETDA
jgi:glycolate oxidase